MSLIHPSIIEGTMTIYKNIHKVKFISPESRYRLYGFFQQVSLNEDILITKSLTKHKNRESRWLLGGEYSTSIIYSLDDHSDKRMRTKFQVT